MAELVINLDELNLRELFEIRHQRTCDGVKSAIRLTIPFKINVDTAIRKDKSTIAGKAVKYECESLVSLHIAGAPEKLIEHRSDTIF